MAEAKTGTNGIRIVSETELVRDAIAFAASRPPESLFYLTRLKPAIFVLHLMGFTQLTIFQYLNDQRLLSCSLSGFKKWLASNVDLDRDSIEYARLNPVLQLGISPPAASAGSEAALSPGMASRKPGIPSPSPIASRTAEGALSPKLSNPETTLTATIESAAATAPAPAGDPSLRRQQLEMLDDSLRDLQARDMGNVAARALDRLDKRDPDSG